MSLPGWFSVFDLILLAAAAYGVGFMVGLIVGKEVRRES